jgi:transposase
MEEAMSTELFVGIDVSKDSLEIGIYPSMEAYRVPNSDPGLDELVLRLEALGAQLIVCEATGGYETLAVSRLAAAKRPILVANARHVRDFAKSIGKLAKTDAIDAGVIARFAQPSGPSCARSRTNPRRSSQP